MGRISRWCLSDGLAIVRLLSLMGSQVSGVGFQGIRSKSERRDAIILILDRVLAYSLSFLSVNVGSLLWRVLKHGQRLVDIETNITHFQYCKVLVVLKFLSLA
jgi:uncharacterized Tic20 family protein